MGAPHSQNGCIPPHCVEPPPAGGSFRGAEIGGDGRRSLIPLAPSLPSTFTSLVDYNIAFQGEMLAKILNLAFAALRNRPGCHFTREMHPVKGRALGYVSVFLPVAAP